jgi:hypothetical protein
MKRELDKQIDEKKKKRGIETQEENEYKNLQD